MNLFLDIETTGLPGKFLNWEKDYKKFPYVVELAWIFKNKRQRFIIHQEGRKIPAEASKIHGITTKMANDIKTTQPASFVYGMLLCDASNAANIIGHNVYFDTSIIKANILRLHGENSEQAKISNDVFHKDKRIDTMKSSQKIFRKWPKLSELHKYLFDDEFKAHSALEDVTACERCYNEMVKRKII